MKRILLIAMTLTAAWLCFGAVKDKAAELELDKVIETIKQNKDADVVRLGRLGMSIFRIALEEEGDDEEDKAILALMKDTKKMTIADYSDCFQADRVKYSTSISQALARHEIIIEIKDDDETVTIYGIFDDKKGTVSDIVMYSPSDCSLILFDGKYEASTIGNLLANEN